MRNTEQRKQLREQHEFATSRRDDQDFRDKAERGRRDLLAAYAAKHLVKDRNAPGATYGACRAAELWNPAAGKTFVSYAEERIAAEIKNNRKMETVQVGGRDQAFKLTLVSYDDDDERELLPPEPTTDDVDRPIPARTKSSEELILQHAERSAVLRRRLEGLKNVEIAAREGINRDTVPARARRAEAQLRETLTGSGFLTDLEAFDAHAVNGYYIDLAGLNEKARMATIEFHQECAARERTQQRLNNEVRQAQDGRKELEEEFNKWWDSVPVRDKGIPKAQRTSRMTKARALKLAASDRFRTAAALYYFANLDWDGDLGNSRSIGYEELQAEERRIKREAHTPNERQLRLEGLRERHRILRQAADGYADELTALRMLERHRWGMFASPELTDADDPTEWR